MDVTKENIDDLNAILKIKITQDDYEERVESVLKDYRKKVNLDGFRQGKVPFGLIKKMYGKSVLVEEINKIISDSLSNYIMENTLNVLGEPLPNKDQKMLDFDKDAEFEFIFDIGLAPEFEINLTKKDKFKYYDITIDDEMIDKYVENYANQFGSLHQVEKS